jgi:hypothetical protein
MLIKAVIDSNQYLVGHDNRTSDRCGECGRRELVTYRCTSCSYRFEVDGVYRYYPQGHGHWHAADDQGRFVRLVREHIQSHSESAAIIPASRCG